MISPVYYAEHSSFGDPTLNGTCIVTLSSAVLQEEGAVVSAADVVSIARSPRDASLGLGTVLMNVNVAKLAYHLLQTLPKLRRRFFIRILTSLCLLPTMMRYVELRFGDCLPLGYVATREARPS
jgi:hypothetical protein